MLWAALAILIVVLALAVPVAAGLGFLGLALLHAFEGTMRTTAMIMAILIAAYFLNFVMETAMITPPIGINLYVVQGLRKRGRIDDVIIGASPFVVTMMLMIVLLSIWPMLALWLPQTAGN